MNGEGGGLIICIPHKSGCALESGRTGWLDAVDQIGWSSRLSAVQTVKYEALLDTYTD